MPDLEDLSAITGANTADGDLLHLLDISAGNADPKDKSLTVQELRDGYLLTGKRNISATTAPTTTDDSSAGYQVGSGWFDVTNDKAYVCVDATATAAVWKEVGGASASPLTTKGDIWVYGSADTRLPVGTNGQILKADSTDAEGMVWAGETVVLSYALSNETTALTTGTAKVTARAPFAMTVTDVRASVTTAPTGSVLTVDINEGGTSILSTKLTIDATEKTSTTAATPAVISDSAIADDAELTFDIDTVGSTVAGAGLKVQIIGTKP